MASHAISSLSSFRMLLMMVWEASKSLSLKSYVRFQPRDPNFFRSWMMAWKQQMLNANFLRSSFFLHDSKNSSLNPRTDPSRLALMPFCGSLVILMLFWSTDTGKYSQGIEVRNSRKSSLWVLSLMASTWLSSSAMNDLYRWQFCSITQAPDCTDSCILARATLSWPWPSEIMYILFSRSSPFTVLAKLMIEKVGSAPCVRMNVSGVLLSESS
mmetsp:Transcript_42517/g.49614  ORF Transcript_42517/g.49614 Transcript_42517/m.49614 type:complete len:213 (+) Transcript_42517:564-1202(+)